MQRPRISKIRVSSRGYRIQGVCTCFSFHWYRAALENTFNCCRFVIYDCNTLASVVLGSKLRLKSGTINWSYRCWDLVVEGPFCCPLYACRDMAYHCGPKLPLKDNIFYELISSVCDPCAKMEKVSPVHSRAFPPIGRLRLLLPSAPVFPPSITP